MPFLGFFVWFVLSGLLHPVTTEPPIVSYRHTVGPAIIFAPSVAQRSSDAKRRVIIVNWNVHVGHGDIAGLIDRLSRTEEKNGFEKPHYVLLLEEAFRRSEDIPASTSMAVPHRIAPPDPGMDIEHVAHKLGWWLYYAPSMRNGSGLGEQAEDRGNAILSSLPLEGVTAVELPFAVQRRVALVATVTDMQKQPKFRVVVTHFDTRAPLLQGWIFGGPAARNNQAKGLVSTLRDLQTDRLPLIVGGDLNTYLGSKAVIDTLSEIADHTNCGNQATHMMGVALDHIFTSIPKTWPDQCARGDSRFGSDHYPLLLRLNVSW